jgi:hypothetical protein
VIPACRRQVESGRDILPAIERLVKVLSLDTSSRARRTEMILVIVFLGIASSVSGG